MKLAILTAALNEAASLPALAARLPDDSDFFVVDDGSTDNTGNIAAGLGARVIRHSVNIGQGYAMLTGMKAILSQIDCGYDYIVYLDADGQHDPLEIPRFIEKAETEGLDVVVGSRVLGSHHCNASLIRKVFLPVITGMVNRLSGYELTDAMCGFRTFRVSTLNRIFPIFDQMLERQYIAAEMFVRLAKAGIRIGEVPVTVGERTSGKSRKGTIRYGYGIMKAIINTLADRNYWAIK